MNTKCKEVNSVKEIYLINANAIKELNENSLKIKRKYKGFNRDVHKFELAVYKQNQK
jgi:hypothetical protein